MSFFEVLYTVVHAEIQKDIMEFLNNRDNSKDIFTDEPFINMKFNTLIEKTIDTKYKLYSGEIELDIIVNIFFDSLNYMYILECSNYNNKYYITFSTSSWTEMKQYVFELFYEYININVYTPI
jgi:hypothetical protein